MKRYAYMYVPTYYYLFTYYCTICRIYAYTYKKYGVLSSFISLRSSRLVHKICGTVFAHIWKLFIIYYTYIREKSQCTRISIT